jgi:hypothetical protein
MRKVKFSKVFIYEPLFRKMFTSDFFSFVKIGAH